MKRLGTVKDSDLTDVTALLRISSCENEVDEEGCCRRRLFSFGVAIITTSSMSITFVVSFGRMPFVRSLAAVAVHAAAIISPASVLCFLILLLCICFPDAK